MNGKELDALRSLISVEVSAVLERKLHILNALEELYHQVVSSKNVLSENSDATVSAVASVSAEPDSASDHSGDAEEIKALQQERDLLQQKLGDAESELGQLRAKVGELETTAVEVQKLRDDAVEAQAKLKLQLEQSLNVESATRSALTNLTLEFQSLQSRIVEVDGELTRERENSAALESERNCLNQQYTQLSESYGMSEARVQTLEAELQASAENNNQLENQVSGLRSGLDNTQALLASAQSQVSNLTADKAALQQNWEQTLQRAESAEQIVASLKALQNRVFPDCLSIPALAPYVEGWKQQIVSDAPNPKLLSMLAHIFSWSSAKETAERCADVPASVLEKDAISGLYNFSRYFFDTLYSQNVEPEEAERIASDLMDAINKELMAAGAKYEIVLPYSGERYESKTMLADSRGSGVGEIYMLRSWGIKNRANDVMHAKSLVQLS